MNGDEEHRQYDDASMAGNVPHLGTTLFFFFKIVPTFVSAMSIYLGYKLFVLGVSGEASLVIDAKSVQGQLINASPGLFFALGGLVALIVSIKKGVKVRFDQPHDQSRSPRPDSIEM